MITPEVRAALESTALAHPAWSPCVPIQTGTECGPPSGSTVG